MMKDWDAWEEIWKEIKITFSSKKGEKAIRQHCDELKNIKLLILTIIVLFAVGIATMVGQVIPGLVIGLFLFGFMVFLIWFIYVVFKFLGKLVIDTLTEKLKIWIKKM